MKKTLVLSLGSNLGNRYANIKQSIALLSERFNTSITEAQYYETPPWGELNQSKFINTAVSLATELSAQQCFEIAQSIEKEMGRLKVKKWGPRNIDIDIIFYGEDTIKTEELEIPHPRLQDRAFVLAPLLDLFPDKKHPETSTLLSSYLSQLNNDAVVFS
mgnify:CR=1 FL=1